MKKFLLIFFFIVINTNLSFAKSSVNPLYNDIGPGLNIFDNIALTGDSYAGYLRDYLKDVENITIPSYITAGSTIVENQTNILNCITSTNCKYIILSIGVNDHMSQTELNIFYYHIKLFAEASKKNNKKLIIHTYMTYPSSVFYNKEYTCFNYDILLIDINSRFDNVIYIPMQDASDESYYQKDNLHCNYKFYKLLIDRIKDAINKDMSE